MPPMKQRMRDSKRNSSKMFWFEAPTAFRTPISWLRSATETSMMFMTPMPPTMREMPATRERIPVMVLRSEPAG